MSDADAPLLIGLMSGTSLDGVDAVLARFEPQPAMLASAFVPMPEDLKQALLALNQPQPDELHACQLAANQLAQLYAQAVQQVLRQADLLASQVRAIANHGQTIRHRPDLGYTVQIGNHALLAELTGLPVIADFRSRDVAAGGQGAPLVPAFHKGLFQPGDGVVNIGGISNLSWLAHDGGVLGFDCGPGNVLLDHWCQRHLGQPFDAGGAWAAQGQVQPALLQAMLSSPFFQLPPPKSTGRDDFNPDWLSRWPLADHAPVDVQATLCALTAQAIVQDVQRYCPNIKRVLVCGGGARNACLMAALQSGMGAVPVMRTDQVGVPGDWLEAFAFAWLGWRYLQGQPGNLPSVTGANGERILGCYYPA
ncbi:anhydro-N-acetylmuramic acid kinase [Leeia sp.]|uniref:anhydro-N-acetylmuramic acid kinase n=1 Tax=Leeia sp. TaxID=2884678 RepID=UPI0035B31D40